MSSQKGFTLKELAEATKSEILGNPNCLIDNLSTIDKADEGSITFLTNKKYADSLSDCKASAVVVSKEFKEDKKQENPKNQDQSQRYG